VYTAKVYVIQVMLTPCYVAIRMDNSARVLNRAGYVRQEFLFLILAQESLLERIFFEMLVKT
jgi:hypothetical protein